MRMETQPLALPLGTLTRVIRMGSRKNGFQREWKEGIGDSKYGQLLTEFTSSLIPGRAAIFEFLMRGKKLRIEYL